MAKKGKKNDLLDENQISCLNCRMANWKENWCIKLLMAIDRKNPVIDCEAYRKPIKW